MTIRTFRTLSRAPLFATIVITVLAVGIGASSTLFTVINGVLLRPLPYRDSDRFVTMAATSAAGEGINLSYPQFLDWRIGTRSVDAMAFMYGVGLRFPSSDGMKSALTAMVSEDFFTLIATQPTLGRLPRREELQRGGPPTILLSHRLWQELGGDPAVVGQQLTTDRGSFTIIGVMPISLALPSWALAWAPVEPVLGQFPGLAKRDWRVDVRVIGRLRGGVTLSQARNDLNGVARRLGQAYPEDVGLSSRLTFVVDEMTSTVRPSLIMLSAAVGVLLLIACANAASLMLQRAHSRHRELAIHTALGADTRRLTRLILSESVTLALIGGALGLGLAWVASRIARAEAPADLPRASEIGLDWRVLFFTVVLCVLVPIAIGLLPALRAARADPADAMKQGARSGGSVQHTRVRSAFIVVQIALTVVLLGTAGVLVRSFVSLRRVSPGYDPAHLVAVRIDGMERKNDTPEKLVAFYERVKAATNALPGVVNATIINHLPMTGTGIATKLVPEGATVDAGREPTGLYRLVDADYFRTVRQPILVGRGIEASDLTPSSHVVVVSASLAQQLWPGQNPVGRRLDVFNQSAGSATYGEAMHELVIGVAGNVKLRSLEDAPSSEVYLPFTVAPWRNTFLVVRVTGGEATFSPVLRRAIVEAEPELVVKEIVTVESIVAASLAERRVSLSLTAVFATIACLLALLGLYGLVDYSVQQRRREIGVRSALGATPAALVSLFLRQGFLLAVVGISIGALLASLFTHLLSSMVYGVGALDPMTYAAVALILFVLAVLATYIPARRAARVDPVMTLRDE